MGLFKLMQDFVTNSTGPPEEEINIETVFGSSPKTSVSERKVLNMQVLDENILRDCVISNILAQLQSYPEGLQRSTWNSLVIFLGQDFVNTTIKTYAQILVHYTKMNIDEDMLKSRDIEMKSITYYDMMISNFIDGALRPLTEDTVIKELSEENATILKGRLLSEAVRLAIMKSISVLQTSPDVTQVDDGCITNLIETAKIYETMNFEPFDNLRGACVHDGIFICTKNISGHHGTFKYWADLVTLASHEFSQYISRHIFGDFNFSSPWKNHDRNEPRFDFGVQNPQPLEMGRNTELVMFDGIQPDWFNSLNKAAVEFIKRLDSNTSSIPIIAKKDHSKLGMFRRNPTPFFGIDVRSDLMPFE